jgi:hypothetical protein
LLRSDSRLTLPLAEAAFTEAEVETMIDYLKERGLFAFVQRFVNVEKISIPKLLLVFGVLIVRAALPLADTYALTLRTFSQPPQLDSLGDQLRILKISCTRVWVNLAL